MGLLVGEFLLWGAMDVLIVVLTIDVLAVGDGWVGYLNAAFAVGGVVGGLAAVTLVGRRLLAPPIACGVVLFGAGFVVIALWPSTLIAVLLLVLSGAGRVLLDVGCRSLLQRTTPSEVLGRVFGLLEGVMMAGLALGSLLVPVLVALGGPKTALIGAGLLLPVLAVLMARPLIAVDRGAKVPVVEIALLRSMPLFAPLPAPALEGVARALERCRSARRHRRDHDGGGGRPLLRDRRRRGRGQPQRQRRSRGFGRGAGFGEIALLEDVPRTANRHRCHRRAAVRAREGPVRDRGDRSCPDRPGGRRDRVEAPRRARAGGRRQHRRGGGSGVDLGRERRSDLRDPVGVGMLGVGVA